MSMTALRAGLFEEDDPARSHNLVKRLNRMARRERADRIEHQFPNPRLRDEERVRERHDKKVWYG